MTTLEQIRDLEIVLTKIKEKRPIVPGLGMAQHLLTNVIADLKKTIKK